MDISLFDFELPEKLIAQYPLENRDDSRLLVVDRNSQKIKHSVFREIVNELENDSFLVLNNSKVVKSRLIGSGKGTGRRCEVFLHKIINQSEFYAFLKPHKKFREGDKIIVGESGFQLEVSLIDKDNINNRIKVLSDISVYQLLERAGHVPLPPYIKREDKKGLDDRRYQTIYAEKTGSVAAPTAGLHFTEQVFESLKSRNILYDFITLYVGIGTFAPVRVKNITEHKMHSEDYEISEKTALLINKYLSEGRKIVSVGTTTVRTLESNFLLNNKITHGNFSTDIFIYPGFRFNVTSMMITNFHLPRSTLFMLVCAFAGRELMLYAYNEAVKEEYRFFSYGDAMLIK
ncbi:MAG: tRNA preQ1(34) S-adenosylmethionine ribosyltransferase-isomerase QueA [Deltaproteobacteria bacterium]|nr:tRNA preQ1(34) S-adenosylmethionine ribosyltransferase-isomerase QueA [Deltaproteobacteria bacterium]